MSEKEITTNLSDNHSFLIRYVKPSEINKEEVGEEIFQLREDRSPPEEYISFFHSKKDTIGEKIDDVKLMLKKRTFKIKNTCGFLLLHKSNAIDEINITNEIISFKQVGYPHYGMYYLSVNIMDIQEAKTILLYNSELYLNKNFTATLEAKPDKDNHTKLFIKK